MMSRSAVQLFVFLLVCALVRPAAAQQHFSECIEGTGENATVVLPAASEFEVGGQSLSVGDEIAAFTREGVCAGVVVWQGESVALRLWGAGAFVEGEAGFQAGEPIAFRVWSNERDAVFGVAEVTYRDSQAHLRTESTFSPDAIYVVDRLVAEGAFAPQGDVRTDAEGEQAARFQLHANYPNPFHDRTTITYELATAGHVQLDVVNALGQIVHQLRDEKQSAGRHSATLTAGNMPNGLYLVRLQSGGATQVRRMVLVR